MEVMHPRCAGLDDCETHHRFGIADRAWAGEERNPAAATTTFIIAGDASFVVWFRACPRSPRCA